MDLYEHFCIYSLGDMVNTMRDEVTSTLARV